MSRIDLIRGDRDYTDETDGVTKSPACRRGSAMTWTQLATLSLRRTPR